MVLPGVLVSAKEQRKQRRKAFRTEDALRLCFLKQGYIPTNLIDPFGLDTSRPGEKTLQTVTVTANIKTSSPVPFWQITIFAFGTPFPKRWIGPVLPNSSEFTTLTSYLLGKIKVPINIFGKTRLYTHTLNGSARYASTWSRFLGRWGSKFFGRASGVLFYYDTGSGVHKFYNEQFKTWSNDKQWSFVNTQMMSGSGSGPMLPRK